MMWPSSQSALVGEVPAIRPVQPPFRRKRSTPLSSIVPIECSVSRKAARAEQEEKRDGPFAGCKKKIVPPMKIDRKKKRGNLCLYILYISINITLQLNMFPCSLNISYPGTCISSLCIYSVYKCMHR